MTYPARVAADGALTIPAELARSIGLAPGDRLTMDADGTSIIVRTYGDIMREGQAAFRATIERPFTLDGFIQERRAAALD